MRIDFTQAANIQIDLGNTAIQNDVAQRRVDANPAGRVPNQNIQQENSQAATPIKTPLPQPSQLSVSLDDKQNVIYRFTDPVNGEVVRQVPPEEILRIVRNIEDLLRESEQPVQKLKVTL
jgi:uncharacterized FlaG/YvyC family protein